MIALAHIGWMHCIASQQNWHKFVKYFHLFLFRANDIKRSSDMHVAARMWIRYIYICCSDNRALQQNHNGRPCRGIFNRQPHKCNAGSPQTNDQLLIRTTTAFVSLAHHIRMHCCIAAQRITLEKKNVCEIKYWKTRIKRCCLQFCKNSKNRCKYHLAARCMHPCAWCFCWSASAAVAAAAYRMRHIQVVTMERKIYSCLFTHELTCIIS